MIVNDQDIVNMAGVEDDICLLSVTSLMISFSKHCRNISSIKPDIGESNSNTFGRFIEFLDKLEDFWCRIVCSVCRIWCCNVLSLLLCWKKCSVICIVSLIGMLTYRSLMSSVISLC